ncbi:putative tricarboxylic transport membrane protein [Spinactinospora alkalitolerans]|uniref:Putative tricarboxylic transport membrane protein n=1 Tax=Spinactinospora alkalitolerans TaxID=687207 RepID=A0A852U0F2_9ACTN|nr:tripartite tricarboxylate transporter permease [Spinactinospora alkalitolerans]NYE48483.1 putative tricarboxylic transport membrane protein [Spinactinospora alkalitolerans]
MDWGLVVQEWALLPNAIMDILTDPVVIIALVAGGLIGIAVGLMPGLTAVMAMSLLLGFMLKLPVEAGLGLLIGVYTGAIYSGSITAIMLNIPGTPAAAVTTLDGFPLAKRGKAREAVGTATWVSFFGEWIGEIVGFLLLPFVAVLALMLGDWELFLVAIVGVLLAGGLAGGSPLKGWIAAFIGIAISMVGTDPIFGTPRFGFTPEMMRGIDFVPVLIGVFGVAEILFVLRSKQPYRLVGKPGRAITRWDILRRPASIVNIIRSALIGVFMGIVPGAGESASPWIAYDIARRRSKRPQDFGKGSHEGLIAAETSNQSTSGGALIPTLTLGIPGSGPTAILLAALFMYGVRPGPNLIVEEPGFIATTIALFLISAVIMRVLAYLASTYFIRLLSIPRGIILPVAVTLGFIGAWGVGFTVFDIQVVLVFGLIGYVLRSRGFPLAPLVLGVLIGPLADQSLRRAILTYEGDFGAMLSRPIGLLLIAFLIVMLAQSLWRRRRRRSAAHDAAGPLGTGPGDDDAGGTEAAEESARSGAARNDDPPEAGPRS